MGSRISQGHRDDFYALTDQRFLGTEEFVDDIRRDLKERIGEENSKRWGDCHSDNNAEGVPHKKQKPNTHLVKPDPIPEFA